MNNSLSFNVILDGPTSVQYDPPIGNIHIRNEGSNCVSIIGPGNKLIDTVTWVIQSVLFFFFFSFFYPDTGNGYFDNYHSDALPVISINAAPELPTQTIINSAAVGN